MSIIDYDTSPRKRQRDPDIYGFVPPTGCGVIFVLMVVNSASQFLGRVMAIALLAAASKTWVVAYLAGDMCLYLLYKLLRNDFVYWIPNRTYAGSIAFSLMNRNLLKVRVLREGMKVLLTPLSKPVSTIRTRYRQITADFTAILQTRHPFELGGSHFTFNLN